MLFSDLSVNERITFSVARNYINNEDRARNNSQTPDNVWPYIEMSGRNKFYQCN